jgi:hypothetical protein
MDDDAPNVVVRVVTRRITLLAGQDAGSVHRYLSEAGIAVSGVQEQKKAGTLLITVDASVTDASLDAALAAFVAASSSGAAAQEAERLAARAIRDRILAKPENSRTDAERLILFFMARLPDMQIALNPPLVEVPDEPPVE